jgi:hypothetical protein
MSNNSLAPNLAAPLSPADNLSTVTPRASAIFSSLKPTEILHIFTRLPTWTSTLFRASYSGGAFSRFVEFWSAVQGLLMWGLPFRYGQWSKA